MHESDKNLNLDLHGLKEHFSHCLHGQGERVVFFFFCPAETISLIPSQLANKID